MTYNRTIKSVFVFFTLFLFAYKMMGQTAYLDSIQTRYDSISNVLNKMPPDSDKLAKLIRLSEQTAQQHLTQAIYYAENALKLAKELKGVEGILEAQKQLAATYQQRGDFSKALKHYQSMLKKAEEMGIKRYMVAGYHSIAYINESNNNMKQAEKYYAQALRLANELKDTNRLASIYNGLGLFWFHKEAFDTAITKFKKGIRFARSMGDTLTVASCYNNIGLIYKEKKEYRKAIEYYKKSSERFKQKGRMEGYATTLNNISFMYTKLGQYEKAIDYSSRALKIADRMGSYIRKMQTHMALFTVYQEMKYYKKALHHYKKHANAERKVFSQQKSKQMAELQMQYETEKKDRKIELLQKEKRIQTLVRNASIGGLVLVLLFAYLIYNRYRVKQKANQQLKGKNEVIRKQQAKIIDSINYAKRIQHSIMLPESEIQKELPRTFIFYRPRDIVSGDFYWFSKQGNKLFIASVDCTGHGVPGGFMSMIGTMLLNEIVNQKRIYEPGKILDQLHDNVQRVLQQKSEYTQSKDGMDMGICMIQPKQKKLLYAGALTPLYLVRNGKIELVPGDFHGIGGLMFARKDQDFQFKTHELDLDMEAAYMLTDGYLDQFGGPNNRKFGIKRFKKLLKSIYQEEPAQQKEEIAKEIKDWQGETRQIDDMLVIGMQFKSYG